MLNAFIALVHSMSTLRPERMSTTRRESFKSKELPYRTRGRNRYIA